MNNLRIAIQSKGRLADNSIKFLRDIGLVFDPNGRNCLVTCLNRAVDILFLRDDDIPQYVERGVADYGIVGENVLMEKRARINVVKKLNFGACELVIAVPINSGIKQIADLANKRFATSYPDILDQYLRSQQVPCEIIQIKGSAEIAPSLDLADAICDLTQTGKTLKENNLRKVATILRSQAVLIKTPYPTKRNTVNLNAFFANLKI